MLGDADGELEADRLIAREQRQESMGRRRRDQLDPATLFEAAQRADEIAIQRAEQREQTRQPLVPEPRDGHELRVARLRE